MESAIILVGSNIKDTHPELHKELVIRATEVAKRSDDGEIVVKEMVEIEVQKVIAVREQLGKVENIQTQIADKENRETIKKDILSFISRVKRSEGSLEWFKNQTTLSWKQFNKVIDNWRLQGFVQDIGDKKDRFVRIIVDDVAVKENILEDIQFDLDNLIQKLRVNKIHFSIAEVKKLSTLEKKLTLDLNGTTKNNNR